MKLSTLASRLATKTNTPVLEEIILGDKPPEALPTECMVWTGATIGKPSGVRRTFNRDADGFRYPYFRRDPVRGVIQVQGKRQQVNRLIFQLLYKPDFEYRMRPRCPEELCVNPSHWEIVRLSNVVEPLPDVSDEEAPSELEALMNESWTQEDVDALLDFVLLDAPTTWEDVVNHDMFEPDTPPEMICEGLRKMNKEHLLP